MTEAAHSLYAEIDELAAAVDSLSPRGKAVIFGVCGRALAPLLRQVEKRSEGRFTVPDLDVALDLIQAFATGSAEAADYSELRAVLEDRDTEIFRTFGSRYWSREIVNEAAVLRPEGSATTAREAQRLQRRFAQGVSSTRTQTEGHEQHERGRCPPRHRGQGTRPGQGQDRHHRGHRG